VTHDEKAQNDTCTCYPILPLTPPDGWTLENLPLADLPKRTELIRGVLVMSPQTSWHADAVYKPIKTHVGRLTTEVPFPIDIPLVDPTLR
jgi:hypothetical protein